MDALPITPPRFQPGDQVVWRSRPDGSVGYVIPTTVVVDSPTVTVLYQGTGTLCRRRTGQRGGPHGRNLLTWDGGYAAHRWNGPSTLRLYRWGTSYTIIRNWDTMTNTTAGWYINLERPWQRTRIGFDTEDLVLDITVTDDGVTWAWKDEDELAWSAASGRITVAEAAHIRAIGWQAIADLEARSWPFADDWAHWRPDAHWPMPGLPTDWDNPAI